MRLIELELTNIKSYKHEIIKFSEGINCILGLNGSGKSTIIESIGSVLFNYNQRTTNNLLRYNETKGQISLLFEGNDNKLYRVIKNLRNKGNSNLKIIDEENNQVLQETVSDVYEFIKKVLNIPKEKSISKLFEEIIAVPQGMFVNAFLETPKNRKENFDKLFELDIYKKLADELKALSDKVQKEYIFTLEKEIAKLDGNLKNYNQLQEEEKNLKNKIEKDDDSLKNISTIYNKKKLQKEEIEQQVKHLDLLNNNKKEKKLNVDNINEQLKIYNDSLKKSKKAKKILLDNEFGYNLYLKTNDQLKLNEEKYAKFTELSKKLTQNEKELSLIQEQNKYLKQTIHDQKIQRGLFLTQIQDKQKEIEDKKIQIKDLELKQPQLKSQIKDLEIQTTNIKTTYGVYLDKLNNINTHLLSWNFQNNDEKVNEKIKYIDDQLAIINENKNKIVEREKEKIRVVSDLNNLTINEEYISDGLCPILKQKCQNFQNSSLSEAINNKKQLLNDSLYIINKEINVLLSINSKEDELIQEKELLLLKQNNYIKEKERLEAIIEDLLITFSNENLDINQNNIRNIVSDLLRKYQSLLDSYQNKELKELKNQDLNISNMIYSSKNNIQITQKLIEELEKNIQNLDENITKNNELYSKNDFDISNILKNNEEIKEKLIQYQNLEKSIIDNKKVLEKYFNNYSIYISKQEEANNIEKYQKLVESSNALIIQLMKEINDIDIEIKKLDNTIAKDHLNELVNEINELNNQIIVLQNTISINNELLTKIIVQIEELNKYLSEKQIKEQQLKKYSELDIKYKLIRNVFINLPKELSKQIRKYVSTYSSSLYRKISNENVRIELLDDYEVLLIDCLDETKTKTLSQLSGGEQMSVAIAIRLAMLKQITNVEFYFMDEPTINLDYERRMMVGEVVKDISSELKQLFVISHDDTFESITDNSIKIIKHQNESILDS